jgi:hypothetical protein
MFSLSGSGCAPLVLWREETVAITFSFTRSAASILGKVDGGGFEDNSTCTAVVSRADRACCADTSGLRMGEGSSQRHGCHYRFHPALHCFCPWAVGFRIPAVVGNVARVEEGARSEATGYPCLMDP